MANLVKFPMNLTTPGDFWREREKERKREIEKRIK